MSSRVAELFRRRAALQAEIARVDESIAEQLAAGDQAPPASVPRGPRVPREPYRPPPREIPETTRARAKRAIARIVPR